MLLAFTQSMVAEPQREDSAWLSPFTIDCHLSHLCSLHCAYMSEVSERVTQCFTLHMHFRSYGIDASGEASGESDQPQQHRFQPLTSIVQDLTISGAG